MLSLRSPGTSLRSASPRSSACIQRTRRTRIFCARQANFPRFPRAGGTTFASASGNRMRDVDRRGAVQGLVAAFDPWESLTAFGGCSSALPYRSRFMLPSNSQLQDNRTMLSSSFPRPNDMTTDLELYHGLASTCSKKVRLCLYEKGLTFKSHLMNLQAFEQHRPEYLKLNPNGVVPTLVHKGEPIVESNVIIEYIDDEFPHAPLRPAGALGRAKMRWW